jgi:ABC-type multidrug transport system fused ATPase/permease subunit
MSTFTQLKLLYLQNRLRLWVTYGLTLLENIAGVLQPLVIGHAINTLLDKRYDGVLIFGVFWVVYVGTSTLRRVYDTRTFTHIYGQFAADVVLRQHGQGVEASKVIARSTLAKEFVDFFERDVPSMMTSGIGLVGAVVMLFTYDLYLGLFSLILFFPLVIINYFNARRSYRLNKNLNDELEREAEVILGKQSAQVQQHYSLLAKWRVKLSNLEAVNFSLMEIFILALVVAVLIRTASLNVRAGDIYAVLSFVYNLIGGLDVVPALVQQVSRLRDIGGRTQGDLSPTKV